METELITPETTVNEAVQRFPATLAVFRAFGLDTCCGGAAPLAVAAARHGADPGELLEAVRAAASG